MTAIGQYFFDLYFEELQNSENRDFVKKLLAEFYQSEIRGNVREKFKSYSSTSHSSKSHSSTNQFSTSSSRGLIIDFHVPNMFSSKTKPVLIKVIPWADIEYSTGLFDLETDEYELFDSQQISFRVNNGTRLPRHNRSKRYVDIIQKINST